MQSRLEFIDAGYARYKYSAPGGSRAPGLSVSTFIFRDAARFWEPRRLMYNLILLAVFLAWVVSTWPHLRPALAPFPMFQLGVLALLANLCYSAAYLPDITFQLARTGKPWRSALWITGTVFAIVVENYWIADEIYPYVR